MKTARVSEQEKDLRVSAGVDTHSHLIREPVKVLTLNVMTNRDCINLASNRIVR